MTEEWLVELAYRKRRGLPCWCGNPNAAHAGWLNCAAAAAVSAPSPPVEDQP